MDGVGGVLCYWPKLYSQRCMAVWGCFLKGPEGISTDPWSLGWSSGESAGKKIRLSDWLQQGARKRKQRRDHFHNSHEKDWYAQQPHGSAITVQPPAGIAKMKIARKTKQNKKCYIQQPPCHFFLMLKLWLTAHQLIRHSSSEIMQFHLHNPSESSLTS